MSSEEMQKQADALNDLTSLITKLNNLQSALRDYDRLRLDGARFLNWQDEEFQEYAADMDGIRMLCQSIAGDAVRAELTDASVFDHLCSMGEQNYETDIDDGELRVIGAALDRAMAKTELKLQKILMGD
jgi:hypothetical protein